ncbi:fibroblast growth factor-binding protein 2-like [Mobula hypostoma]|uniref:fibroblast growth factor-binding protein 2-like n=1 Tax=Mobula hypostoma TaxID=723540 RepID=UPI002FC36AE2
MKFMCIVSLFLFLLCLTFSPGEGAKSADGSELLNRLSKKRKGKLLATKGALTTKDDHACTWNVTGEEELVLQISCSYQGGSYSCNYTGRPQSCPTYNSKAFQYWKQVISKVKKKKHACEGDKSLKARVCKKAPTESQMKLQAKSWDTRKRRDKVHLKGAGRRRALGKVATENAFASESVNSTETRSEKNWGKSGAPESSKSEDPNTLGEMRDDDPEVQEELSRAYCAEKWHSLCSFFVNLWNG